MSLLSFLRRGGSFAVLATTVSLLLASCDQTDRVTGRSDETHTSVVDIQGRVLTSDARPLANVIVRLRTSGLTDTTDADGLFRLQLDSAPVSESRVMVVDTLDYLRDGQAILSAAVPAWVTTMPDVMLVQRDLSGAILGDPSKVSRVVCGLWLPDGSTQWVDLELNKPLARYSGFAYFRYTGGRDSFAARVEARDDSGRLLGRSVGFRFSSLAGDVAIPTFTLGNILPKVSIHVGRMSTSGPWASDTGFFGAQMADSAYFARRESVRLFARISDTLDRYSGLEWNVGGSGWVRHQGQGRVPRDASGASLEDAVFDTVITVPAGSPIRGTIMVMARVRDREGAYHHDTLCIRVAASRPLATVELDPEVSSRGVLPGESVGVTLHDGALFGKRIVRRTLHLAKRTEFVTMASSSCLSIVRGETVYVVDGQIVRQLDPWTQPVEPPSDLTPIDCGDGEEHRYYELDSVGPGISVSGADTTITLPADSVAEYAFVYTVVDEDGEVGAESSLPVAARGPRPNGVSLATEGDSLVIRWTSPIRTPHGTWLLEGRWNETGDSLRLRLPDSSRRAAVLQPLHARSLGVRLAHHQGWIAGFAHDTSLPELAHPGLRFTGAMRDSSRLGGAGLPIGLAEAWFSAAVGTELVGEVAKLEWSIGSSPEANGAVALFFLPSKRDSKVLRLDLANRSALPVRIEVLAPDVPEYIRRMDFGRGLGWDVPAGFVGSLSLSLDSATWPKWIPMEDDPDLDARRLLGAITGIRSTVARVGGGDPLRGSIEFDNLRWE